MGNGGGFGISKSAPTVYNPVKVIFCPKALKQELVFSIMLDTKSLFNESYYLAKNPAVATAVANGSFPNAFAHFTQFGQFEGRSPSALFDTNYYVLNNPDVAAAVNSKATTAIQHFINFGEAEGRNPSAFYNNSYYLGKNPDVAAAVDRD